MRALITGVTGQDGSYLAEHLADLGYEVYGLIHGQDNEKIGWIKDLVPGIRLVRGDLLDQASLLATIHYAQPDEVYNLAAISSPGLAWGQPELTAQVTGIGVLRLLQSVHAVCPDARVLQASSIAKHGPYGAAKQYAHGIAQDFRDRGLLVSCAVMGGHHSPRRGLSFFSRKVTRAVAMIKLGLQEDLVLGNLERKQDWGWAVDFVRQFPRILQLAPDDYIMSTGEPYYVSWWVESAFRAVDLNWSDYVRIDHTKGNLTDVPLLSAFPDPRLNWQPNLDFNGLVQSMVYADIKAIENQGGGK